LDWIRLIQIQFKDDSRDHCSQRLTNEKTKKYVVLVYGSCKKRQLYVHTISGSSNLECVRVLAYFEDKPSKLLYGMVIDYDR